MAKKRSFWRFLNDPDLFSKIRLAVFLIIWLKDLMQKFRKIGQAVSQINSRPKLTSKEVRIVLYACRPPLLA